MSDNKITIQCVFCRSNISVDKDTFNKLYSGKGIVECLNCGSEYIDRNCTLEEIRSN